MEKTISCPFCQSEIPANTEICPHCENEMPWMSHIYKRENSVFRAVRNFFFDVISSLTKRKRPDKDKVLGLVNALMIGRAALILGSLLGTALLVVEIMALNKQNEIMEQQTVLMRNQDQLMSNQNLISEFEQYSKIRDLLSDTTYTKAIPTQKGKLPTSSPHAIDFIVRLANAQPTVYSSILEFLLNDQNHTIRSGALLCLMKMKNYKSKPELLRIQNIDFGVQNLVLDSQKYNRMTIINCKIPVLEIENTAMDWMEFHNSEISFIGLTNVVLNSFISSESYINKFHSCYSVIRTLSLKNSNPERRYPLSLLNLMATYIEIFESEKMEYYKKKFAINARYSKDESLEFFIKLIELNEKIDTSQSLEEMERFEKEEKEHIKYYIENINEKRNQIGYRKVDRGTLKFMN